MEVAKLAEGLWRWTAPHPEWAPGKGGPGGWERMVGSLYYEPVPAAGAPVLIDPLAPPEGSSEARRFWEALDQDVARAGRPVAILLANSYHERSAETIRLRYAASHGAAIWAHADAQPRLTCRVEHTFRSDAELPCGVVARPIEGLDAGETAYYLPARRALVLADALVGSSGGRVRVPPERWAADTPEGKARYRDSFRGSLRRLLDLPIGMLLVSHGPPVLENGRAALEEALEAPAWGA